MSIEYICPNCGRREMKTFYKVNNIPVHSCVLMSTKRESLDFPNGDIKLGFCKNCGFISNVDFDPALLDYSINYEDQQCFSPTFNAFARDLANRIVEKYELYNKNVLEIGCGTGDFLSLLCKLGNNRGVGIDPAIVIDRINSETSKQLTFIKDYYSDKYAEKHGDLVCCRHTLEHIYDTREFVHSIRRAIGDRLNTIIFFEVPDVTRILHETAFWDIYYEHCSYFSPGSLARLFRLCGFEIIELSRDFGDQYLLIEARPVNEHSNTTHELEESTEEMEKYVKHFSLNSRKKLDDWKNRLEQIELDGLRAVVWGSGSKCVSFITTLAVKDEIEVIIDINPYRHGKFLPGVGKKIMSPQYLKKYQPDVTIVMNPVYRDEIGQMIDDMGVSTEIITVD
jgi:SAM-dependent methyltransferase